MSKRKTTMNDLVYRVAMITGHDDREISKILKEFVSQMKGDVCVGIPVELRGFGTFRVKKKEDIARKEITLPNGKKVYTGNKNIVKFIPSGTLSLL